MEIKLKLSGDQKCKSMRKLAGRTLIDILPPKVCRGTVTIWIHYLLQLTVYMEDKFGDLNKVTFGGFRFRQ